MAKKKIQPSREQEMEEQGESSPEASSHHPNVDEILARMMMMQEKMDELVKENERLREKAEKKATESFDEEGLAKEKAEKKVDAEDPGSPVRKMDPSQGKTSEQENFISLSSLESYLKKKEEEAENGMSAAVKGLVERVDSNPLQQHIQDFIVPSKFTVPKFSLYDGSKDPFDHV